MYKGKQDSEHGEGREKKRLSVRKIWEAKLLSHVMAQVEVSGDSRPCLGAVYSSGKRKFSRLPDSSSEPGSAALKL